MSNLDLEKLFNIGRVSETVSIMDVKFTLNILDTLMLTDALNAAHGTDSEAIELSYKTEILARAISHINGVARFKDAQRPEPNEINANLNEVLARVHFSVVLGLFAHYKALDDKITKAIDTDVKKSLSNRGV